MMRDYSYKCTDCGTVKTYTLDEAKVDRWKAGGLIQNLFPEIEDREIMISGTCSDCFDKLFADEDSDVELDSFEDEGYIDDELEEDADEYEQEDEATA